MPLLIWPRPDDADLVRRLFCPALVAYSHGKKKGQHILGENHLKTEQGLYKNHDHTSPNQVVDMLWLNFILGLNFIFLCFGVWKCMIMTFKQTEIKLKPRIKLNHNRYVANFFHGVHVQCR